MLVRGMADAMGVEFGEEVDGFAIGERAELSADGRLLERGHDVHHRFRWFESTDIEERAGVFANGAAGAGGWTKLDGRGCGDAGDLDLKFVGTLDEVFPGEGVGKLRGELVVERDGIVVVDQDEVFADGEAGPPLEDERVFFAAGDHAHVEVGGREVGGCIHKMGAAVEVYSAQRVRSIVNGSGARTA